MASFVAGGIIMNVVNGSCSAFIFLLCVFHMFRIYQDLFTSKRKSLSHRRYLPERNPLYKMITWSTILSAVNFLIGRLSIFAWGWVDNGHVCNIFLTISFISFNFGKLFMYWIFLFRLRAIYGKTSFAYNTRWLNFWSVFFLIYALLIIAVLITGTQYLEDRCVLGFNIYLYITIGLILVQDVFFSITFVIAFIVPLRAVIKHVDEVLDATAETEQHHKIIYYGIKVTTLTAVVCISTIVTFALLAAVQLSIISVDMIFNVVCLFLMTPYYADALYYQRICWVCVNCCAPKINVYKSKVKHGPALSNVDSTIVVSADTVDQLRIAATQFRNSRLKLGGYSNNSNGHSSRSNVHGEYVGHSGQTSSVPITPASEPDDNVL